MTPFFQRLSQIINFITFFRCHTFTVRYLDTFTMTHLRYTISHWDR